MTNLSLESISNYPSKVRFLDTGAEILAVITDSNGRISVSKDKTDIVSQNTETRVTTGLVDLQVNGFGGVDFNDANITADDMDKALKAMLSTGVTTCLPTIITASKEQLQRRFQALDKAVTNSKLGPLMVPGYHLEGPFLNVEPGYAGCHPAKDMVLPSIELIKELEQELCRPILYITLAPELENASKLISWATGKHKIVGAGHSALSPENLCSAIDNGLQLSTHLGNGVPQVVHKFNNSILWQLAEDRLNASFIADGVHIPSNILKIFIRAKGINQSILVTDGTSSSKSSPGRHYLAGIASDLNEDGIVHVAGSTMLAGSALSLDQAVSNIVNWKITDFRSALRMASANPLALLAPAMHGHAMNYTLGEVVWGDDNLPVSVNLGSCRYNK